MCILIYCNNVVTIALAFNALSNYILLLKLLMNSTKMHLKHIQFFETVGL